MSKVKLFRQIPELYTLAGVAKKKGRSIQAEDLTLVRQAAMLSDAEGRLIWIGPERDLKAKNIRELVGGRKVREVKLDGGIVLPAFTECHTHLVFAGDRSNEFEARLQGASYQEIAAAGGGILSTVRATRRATFGHLQKLAQVRLDSFVAQGATVVEVKSGYGLDLATEIKILKVARGLKKARVVTTYLGLHALPPEFTSRDEYRHYVLEVVLPKIARLKLADRVDVFVEKGFFTKEDLGQLALVARSLDLPMVVHADQLSRTGVSVAAAQAGALSVDHVVEVNDQDIQRLAHFEATCVLLPTSDFYLKMKYPPARALLDAGVAVALASDFNPGTSPSQDINWVGLLARVEMRMTLTEVLAAYIYNSAQALGLSAERGSLEVGKQCDFIYLDGSLRELFYASRPLPIKQVWAQGKCLHKISN